MCRSLMVSLVLLGLAAAPATAQAGFSLGAGYEVYKLEGSRSNGWGTAGGLGGVPVLPTIDFYTDPVIIQFHAIDFLVGLTSGDVVFGANAYFPVVEGKLVGPLKGVIQPGASLDITSVDYGLGTNIFGMGIAGACRFGFEAGINKMHLGVYVVPTLGVSFVDGPGADIMGGGSLATTFWYDL